MRWDKKGAELIMAMNKPLYEREKIIRNYLRAKASNAIPVTFELFVKTETLPGLKSVPRAIQAINDPIKLLTMPIY